MYIAIIVPQFLTKRWVIVLYYSLYPSDLTPLDYFCSLKLNPLWKSSARMKQRQLTNLLRRACSYLVNEGGNFEHLLWFKSYYFVKIYAFFTLSLLFSSTQWSYFWNTLLSTLIIKNALEIIQTCPQTTTILCYRLPWRCISELKIGNELMKTFLIVVFLHKNFASNTK